MRIRSAICFSFVSISLWVGGSVNAGVIAYDNAANVGGLQKFGNALGLDFDVNLPITVTDLGAFDNGTPSELVFQDPAGVRVSIFDRDTQSIVAGPLTFANDGTGTRVNGNLFKPLASPVNLAAGFHGRVVAWNSPNYNSNGPPNTTSTTNTGGGAISFVGLGVYGFTAGGYPTNVDGGPANRYDMGSFIFTVPEPSSYALLALGLAALSLVRRRRD